MGLWSYIFRLTLLLKGKQKKSRAAPRETARVFTIEGMVPFCDYELGCPVPFLICSVT
jgi:hypothetical protein